MAKKNRAARRVAQAGQQNQLGTQRAPAQPAPQVAATAQQAAAPAAAAAPAQPAAQAPQAAAPAAATTAQPAPTRANPPPRRPDPLEEEGGKTPWGMIATGAVVLLLLAFIGGAYVFRTPEVKPPPVAQAPAQPAPAPQPAAPAQPAAPVATAPADPSSTVVKYGTGKELFAVEGTPVGFTFDGVSDASKASACKAQKGTLVRSEVCRKHSNGQVECKNQCRLPDGKLIGSLTW